MAELTYCLKLKLYKLNSRMYVKGKSENKIKQAVKSELSY